MKISRSKLWLIITVIIGLVTTALIMTYLKNIKEEASSQPMVKVVLAAKKIPQGTRLSGEMLKTVEMPEKYASPQWVGDAKSIINKFAAYDFEAEDIILREKLTDEKTSNQLTYKVPEGKRAVTTAINPPSGVAGHIKPGDYVDVLAAYKKEVTGIEEEMHESTTILQNALVLAVGADLQRKDGIQSVETVTLALTPQDAQILYLSETIGKIKLTLRQAGDHGTFNLKSLDDKAFKMIYPN